MIRDTLTKTWERIALLGCLVTAAGSVPVWFTLQVDQSLAALMSKPDTVTRGGIEGDGVLTLFFAALVALVLVVVSYRADGGAGRKAGALTLVSGLLSGLIAYVAFTDLREVRDRLATYEAEEGVNATVTQSINVEVHSALYVVIAGSTLIIVGGILGTLREGTDDSAHQREEPEPTPTTNQRRGGSGRQ